MRGECTCSRNNQAQSEVIGVILILGITFTGISIIWVTGNPSLDSTKELARTSAAENSLALLDERVSSAALSGAEKKQFTLNLQSGELSVSPETGSIRVFSSSPSEVWASDAHPGETDVVHTLNFTVEAGSDVAGNATDPAHLEEITVRYPSGFDVGDTDGNYGVEGVDKDLDGDIDESLSEDSTDTDGTTELNINFDGSTEINVSDRFVIEYDDIDQPPTPGDYTVEVTVENDEGESVKKETVIRIANDAEPPVRQIDTKINMGKIEYETVDSVVAYQNGGVWRKLKTEEGVSRTVSKPEVYYDGNTLTASVINITNTADISLGGRQSLTATNTENERIFPVQGTERTNPLQDRNVYIEVNTTYYDAWSGYFESETVGDVVEVIGGGDQRTVRVELSPLPDTVFNQAIATRNGNISLRNTVVDSYDSAVSDYSPRFRFGNADITAAGNVSFKEDGNPSQVYGNVLSGDRVFVSNESIVNGSVKAHGYGGAPDGENITVIESGGRCRVQDSLVAPGVIGAPDCPSSSQTESKPSEQVPVPELVDKEIEQRIEDYSDSPNYLPDGAGKTVLNVTPGNYYVDEDHDTSAPGPGQLDWNNKKVRFETDGGPINIAVKNGSDTTLRPSNTVFEIDGNNPVRIYSGNYSTSFTNSPKIEFRNITMGTTENRTDLFTLFVHSTNDGVFTQYTNVTLREGTQFYGTVYAPDSDQFQVSDSQIHGAIVAGEADIVNSGIHYDQQLRDPAAEGVSAVNYLHVTDNRVRVR